MNSYNKKSLDKCDFCELGHNPNCGDEIKLQVKLNGDIIENQEKKIEIEQNKKSSIYNEIINFLIKEL